MSARLSFPTLALLLSLPACGGAPPAKQAEPAAQLAPPTLTELLPLKDRTVSSFKTSSDLGDEGLLVLEIFRPRPDLAELKIAGRIQRLKVSPQRVSYAAGGTLLETPLEVGHSFRGSFGTTKITETDRQISLPAGDFEQCLVTVEESTRPAKRSTSIYCRNVGLVSMEIESFGAESQHLQTRLSSHGPRFDVHDDNPGEAPGQADRPSAPAR